MESILREEVGEPPQVQVDHRWSKSSEQLPQALFDVCHATPVVAIIRGLKVQFNPRNWRIIDWRRLDSLLAQFQDLEVVEFRLESFEYGLGRDNGECLEVVKDIATSFSMTRGKCSLRICIEEDEIEWKNLVTQPHPQAAP